MNLKHFHKGEAGFFKNIIWFPGFLKMNTLFYYSVINCFLMLVGNASAHGDEAQPDNSLGVADIELTKQVVNMLISDDSDMETSPQISRAANDVISKTSNISILEPTNTILDN